MRSILSFVVIICFHSLSWAAGRTVTCDSVDSFQNASQIEFNIDTGYLRMKEASGWTDLYTEQLACGLKVGNPNNCVKKISHNFDNPQAISKAAVFSVRCKSGSNNLTELNGDLEINRSGNGAGSFVCGRLSKHALYLTQCRIN